MGPNSGAQSPLWLHRPAVADCTLIWVMAFEVQATDGIRVTD